MRIDRSSPADLPAIEALLVASGLPPDGAAAAFGTGLVARAGDRIVGCAAIEPHGRAGLLRSVAVAPEVRGGGVGSSLVGAAAELAARLGIGELYLLTETAADWFPRFGYESVDRTAVPVEVASSVEFAVACPATAVAFVRRLPESAVVNRT